MTCQNGAADWPTCTPPTTTTMPPTTTTTTTTVAPTTTTTAAPTTTTTTEPTTIITIDPCESVECIIDPPCRPFPLPTDGTNHGWMVCGIDPPTTTTVVSSSIPLAPAVRIDSITTTTVAIAPTLPVTGSADTPIAAAGGLTLAIGLACLLGARYRRAS